MAFPTNNVHRRNRRKNTAGAASGAPPVTCVITGSGATAILTFSSPVNVKGTIPLTVATRTFVSQAITSPTVVTITYSGAVAGLAWSLAQPIPGVSTPEGAVAISVASSTFS